MTAQDKVDFPLPPDLEGSWLWDKLHCPRPLTPLEHELLLEGTAYGFSKAMGEMGSSLRAVCRSINYYNYLAGMPRDDIGGEDPDARDARYKANVVELTADMGRRWREEWLPAILPQLERGRSANFAAMSDDELRSTFATMVEEMRERWYIHGLLLYSFFAAGVFADFYRQSLQQPEEKEGYEALQGFESKALDSSRALWQLSRTARNTPALRTLFETSRAEELPAKLEASDAGRAFLADLRAYLDEYGWRADSVYELTHPAWREDPGIALNAIQGYLSIADERSPDAQYESAVKRRESLMAEARRRLAGDELARFDQLYEAASSFTPIVEDHNHYIDQTGNIMLRYPALELGRRLVKKGALAAPEDVFMLRRDEIDAAFAGGDYKALAESRRTEMQRFARVVPPLYLGPPPPPSDDPIADVIVRFFGVPVEPSSDPSVISGVAASPGLVQGPAKVVRDLAEASKVMPGDILVCEMTLPTWTPLFSTIAAVVADTGGILSHCAIVAREYRIPCVVGTMVGTSVIKDGMRVTVDGARGIVRIDS